MDRRLGKMFDRISDIRPVKMQLTSTHRGFCASLLNHLEDFYLSPVPWRDREAKKLAKRLKQMLQGNPAPQEIKDIVDSLKDQVLNTSRI